MATYHDSKGSMVWSVRASLEASTVPSHNLLQCRNLMPPSGGWRKRHGAPDTPLKASASLSSFTNTHPCFQPTARRYQIDRLGRSLRTLSSTGELNTMQTASSSKQLRCLLATLPNKCDRAAIAVRGSSASCAHKSHQPALDIT